MALELVPLQRSPPIVFAQRPLTRVRLYPAFPQAVQDVIGNGRFMEWIFICPASRQVIGVSPGDIYLLREGSLQESFFIRGPPLRKAFGLGVARSKENLNADDNALLRPHHKLDSRRRTAPWV